LTFHWADFVLMVVIVVAGVSAGYLLLLRKVRHIVSESHRGLEHRLIALTEAISAHEPGMVEPTPSTDTLDAKEIEAESIAAPQKTLLQRVAVPGPPDASEREEMPAEIQVAIAAAAVALLGNNARVLAARRIPSQDVVSPWTQQGRVTVQSSHNLRPRR
jgi:hypothetical protein